MPIPLLASRLSVPATLFALFLLAGCASTAPAPEFSSFVVMGEHGAAVARVILAAPVCPELQLDGRSVPMIARAGPAIVAQRPTQSAPADSKPSAFPVLTCEAAIPAASASAKVLGRALPVPVENVRRIVVIGDTGCRLKKSSKTYQACNDAQRYPFAQVAASAAAWKPDLVIHVGDYEYRENACPPDQPGCAGSPWGYGWDAWRADFFQPGRKLLDAAPWVVARGNHESCRRAGQGFWRFLDPRPLQAGHDCNDPANDALGDYSDPYAVALGAGAQLLVFDSSNTSYTPIAPTDPRTGKYADTYRKLDALAQRAPYNIGVDHHPLLGMSVSEDDGPIRLQGGDAGLQSVFGRLNPALLPASIQVMLSGHIHLWEQISFASDHPSQFITGFSGTDEDIVPLPATLPPDALAAPGALADQFSSWVDGFGFMTMERRGPEQWDVTVWSAQGKVQNTCQIAGRKSRCALPQVP